jgi:hypothetical protein
MQRERKGIERKKEVEWGVERKTGGGREKGDH